jgi:hypothetical protein
MQFVNFQLISMAFIVAGYGTALRNNTAVAAGAVALVGLVVALAFWRLDIRTRDLVVASEQALDQLQTRLADRAAVPELRLVAAVATSRRLSSYRVVIRLLCLAFSILSLLGAAYALFVFD